MAGWRRFYVGWLVVLGCALALGAPAAAPRTAVVIALDSAIGPASASYVVRSLNEAQRQDAAVVVVRMDTPGGLDSAMRNIIRAMLASPVPVLAYVAPGGARAASAGTYILYAAALAAMAPGTNLGAAAPASLFAPTPLAGSDAKPADDGRQDAVHSEVDYGVGVQAGGFGEPSGRAQARQKRQRHQRAVGVEKRNMQDFRVHWPPAAGDGAYRRATVRSRPPGPNPPR